MEPNVDEVAVSAIQDMKCHPTGEVADEVHVAEQIHLRTFGALQELSERPVRNPQPATHLVRSVQDNL